jgi:hypothetical protein
MSKKYPAKSFASTNRRLDRVLQEKLCAFDIKQHGGELMAWAPVGTEVFAVSPAHQADDLSRRDPDALRKVADAALPKDQGPR